MKANGTVPARARLRSLLLLLSVLACACVSGAPARGLVMRDVSFPLRDMRFPSGLRVIIEEDHRAPIVGVFALVGVGSTSDPPGKEGLAHYVEHLAFRARPDGKTSIWGLLGRAGAGEWNASTGLDYTLYYEIGPKEALPGLLTLEGVRQLGPVAQIAPETASVELEVVRNELRQRNETGFLGATLGHMQKALFPPDHAYARPVIGSHESLSAIGLEDAQRFVEQHYKPDNITMVVVGDVDLQTVNRVIEESLPPALRAGAGAKPPKARLDPVAPPPPAPPEGGMARYQMAVPTPELWIGWTLPRAFDAEGYLDEFLAAGLNRQLPRAFMSDPDIAAFEVELVPGKEASMLLCRIGLRDGSHPERSFERVLDQIFRVALQPGSVTFGQAQRGATMAMILDVESPRRRGRERAVLTHFSGDAAAMSRSFRAVMSVEGDKFSAFATKYLTRERARSILITPLPGRTPPPEGSGHAGAAPRDEPPPALGMDAIRQYIRPPGVRSYLRETLDNGLEVIVGRRAGLPLVTVALSLHGGTATSSPPGAAEVARRLAHARVTSKLGPADFGALLREVYDRDDVRYVFQGSSGNVANLLEMLADRAPNMRVTLEQIAFFRREGLPFLQRWDAQPETRADRAFWSALYGAHPYGRSAAFADLEGISAGDANDFVARVTVPKNAVLAVIGEVDPEATLAQVRETFGRWSKGDAPVPPPPRPALPSPPAKAPAFLVTHRPGASQGEIHFGCLLPPATGAGAGHTVLASIAAARVHDTVRARLGSSYGFHARVRTLRGGAAHLSLTGDVDNARLPKALAVLRSTFDALAQGRFAPGEIDAARWREARHYAVRYVTNASIASAILDARNEDRDLGAIDDFAADLGTVTPESLTQDYARCLTAPAISIVGDEPTVRAAIAEAWP